MNLSTSYKQIWDISFPIMLGSAAQNFIVLSDSIFLYHYDTTQFAAIGIIGAFYLILAAIGFGFSRGGQIFIARKFGEKNYSEIGIYFQALLIFEILLSGIIFTLLYYNAEYFLKWFISSNEIIDYCKQYLEYRLPGLFFSYIGVVFIALYTGIAKPNIILYSTIVLAIVNVILNYFFVFGKFGFPEMGIKGSALASTLAEVVAFTIFIVYMIFDKKELAKYKLFSVNINFWKKINEFFGVSFPIVLQSALGLIAYFIFFTLIENNSKKDLEIANIMRTVYLILSIPIWGFSAGINTLVSNFIGNNKRQAVLPIIKKTAILSTLISFVFTLAVVVFPEIFLYPLFGSEKTNLLAESKDYFIVLLPIMVIFSIGSVFFNGLVGTGHTKTALLIQTIFTIIYIFYIFVVLKGFKGNLYWAWGSEIVYWTGIFIFVYFYLLTNKWHLKKL
jgi:putative MATE family efflux protein